MAKSDKIVLNTNEQQCDVWVGFFRGDPTDYSSNSQPTTWQSAFTMISDDTWDYDKVIYIMNTNFVPWSNDGLICSFLPFFYAAVLFLKGDDPRRILMVRSCELLTGLMQNFPPQKMIVNNVKLWQDFIKTVQFEVIDVGEEPQTEPLENDPALKKIWNFQGYHLFSLPFWPNREFQQKARMFHQKVQNYTAYVNAGSKRCFSFPRSVSYIMNTDRFYLNLFHEIFSIDNARRIISLVRRDVAAAPEHTL